MSRKSKIDSALKVELVERYLKDEIGIREAARTAGLSGSGTDTFRKWVNIYQNEGPCGLLEQAHNRCYPLELKLEAVNAYLCGEGSLLEIIKRYNIRSKKVLQDWIKQYNTYGEIRSRGSGGGSYMSKARKTTFEERLEIVQDCLVNDRNYGAMAIKYHCSISKYATGYCTMRRWARKVWKTVAEKELDRSQAGPLRKSSGIRLQNWNGRTVGFRWRMIC